MEPKEQRQTTVRIWQDNETELKYFADKRGLSFGRMINVALAEWIVREKGKLENFNTFEE
jgi:hypothetical protein